MRDIFTIDGKQLQNQISIKFKNTPKFTKQEIEEYGIKIKTPEVLEVIEKWADELEKNYYGLNDGTILENSFRT